MSLRKRLLTVGVAGVMAVAGLSACGQNSNGQAAQSSGPMILKIGVTTGEGDPRNVAAEAFAKDITAKSGGTVTAMVYPSGELGGDSDLVDAVAMGAGKVDIVITDASNYAQYEPTMAISAMPFLFDDFDTAWAFMDSEIEATAEKKLLDDNIRVLAHYDNGFRCVTNSNGPINSPADMKGLLIRTPENPTIMATMTALGANPQPLAFSELYEALKQGTYDAQENPIPVIYNNKLYEVQKYLTVTNHIYSGMCFAISESTWKKLTPEQQQIISEAAVASAKTNRDMNRQQTEELIGKLEEVGMQINYPDLAPFAEATASVLESNASTYGDIILQLQQWVRNH